MADTRDRDCVAVGLAAFVPVAGEAAAEAQVMMENYVACASGADPLDERRRAAQP